MPATSHELGEPTALDLFCGVGGLSLGLHQAGFHLLGGADSDQQVLDTHKANFPDVPTYRCDLFAESGDRVLEGLGIAGRCIDLLAGGPPCQGFSAGGVRVKQDPRNRGIMAFARLVTEIRPRYFLMENVRGFLFHAHDSLRRRFRKCLERAGYLVLPFHILNAVDYGVPQRRERAFVLGCLQSEQVPEYPEPLPDTPPTVHDAIADLVEVDRYATDRDTDVYDGVLGKASTYAATLRIGRDGGQITVQTGCMRTTHSPTVVTRFRATPRGRQEPVSRFFRLCWKSVSPTIRAGTGPDHGSYTAPRPIHPRWPRCITVREAARLHSFPDWFVFRGTRWHGFRQIGNSVPPLLARAVASKVFEVCRATQSPAGRGGRYE